MVTEPSLNMYFIYIFLIESLCECLGLAPLYRWVKEKSDQSITQTWMPRSSQRSKPRFQIRPLGPHYAAVPSPTPLHFFCCSFCFLVDPILQWQAPALSQHLPHLIFVHSSYALKQWIYCPAPPPSGWTLNPCAQGLEGCLVTLVSPSVPTMPETK